MINRGLQHYILCELREAYPKSVDYSKKHLNDSEEQHKLIANLAYLKSHELISEDSIDSFTTMDGNESFHAMRPSITHKGLDFLEDDGGLSAILNTVTVKFETEQLKQLLESKINESDLPNDKKSSAISAIKDLPAESIKHLTTKALDYGLDNISMMKLVEIINSLA